MKRYTYPRLGYSQARQQLGRLMLELDWQDRYKAKDQLASVRLDVDGDGENTPHTYTITVDRIERADPK